MSGSLPLALVKGIDATLGANIRAQAGDAGVSVPQYVRRVALARVAANLKGQAQAAGETLGQRTWRAMSLAMRATLIMCVIEDSRDPRDVARQGWEAFTESQRRQLAIAAQEFHQQTRDAWCLAI